VPDTAIVVPCYNEAARLEPQAFLDALERDPRLTLLLVDDGSTDATPERLAALARRAPERIGLLTLPANRGKAEAVRRGMLAAFERAPRFAGYWDADLATPFEAVAELRAELERRPEIAIVLGARVQLLGRTIDRSPLRHYAGRVFATLASITLGWPVYDTQCGAKLLRVTDETKRLFADPFLSGWAFDVELLARFDRERRGADRPAIEAVVELPLTCWRDRPGSKVRPWDFLLACRDLLRIGHAYRR